MLVEQTPEGLRIQLVDAEGQAMFALGGAAPNDRARALLARVAQVATRLPNPIAVAGHTDATPFRGGGERSNWDLSAERANATRRLLLDGGLPEARIRSVTGNADRDLLLPDQPNAAANRRVSITLLRLNRDEPAR
jgi:chemotaxis protein MotB